MAITRELKEQHVKQLNEYISKSHSIIVWDYLGLSSEEIFEVRKNIKKTGAENIVFKNRLAKIAFKKNKKTEIIEHLVGPSSFLFIFDEDQTSLKHILKASKDTKGKIDFKVGYIDGVFHTKEQLIEIAGLPTKDELISQLLSVLQGNMRNLAYSLSQISKTSNNKEESKKEVKKEVDNKEDKKEKEDTTKREEKK